ncbi:MAG TPA: hypothetical protein VK485_09645 [Sphingomicrobium sp.]|nr:hypothetical protein [Sphingomicrobium sp.]
MTRIYHATAALFADSNAQGTIVRMAFATREGDLEVLIPTAKLSKLLPTLSKILAKIGG